MNHRWCRKSCFWGFLLILLAGCITKRAPLTYFHPQIGEEKPHDLLHQAAELEREDFENIRFKTIAQNTFSSHHLVIIKKEEPVHYHERHDLWFLVLKGKGNILLKEKTLKLYPGTSAFVPAGMWHRVKREGIEPLAALVIFTPPFEGEDNIRVSS